MVTDKVVLPLRCWAYLGMYTLWYTEMWWYGHRQSSPTFEMLGLLGDVYIMVYRDVVVWSQTK